MSRNHDRDEEREERIRQLIERAKKSQQAARPDPSDNRPTRKRAKTKKLQKKK